MLDRNTTNRLILNIFEAVENPSRWQAFLDGFTQALGYGQSALMVWTLEYEHNAVACYAGATEEDRREYLERWMSQDPWMTRAQKDAPEGVFVRSNEITPDDVLERTEVYQQYLKPRNWHYGGGVILLRSPVLLSTLSTTRAKEKGPITEQERAWIMQLVPFLQTAARLHESASRLRAEHEASRAHLEQFPHSVAIVGPEGYLLISNRRMQSMLDAGDGLALHNHRLSLRGEAGRELEEWAKQAQRGPVAARRFVVERPSGRRSYWVTVTPIVRPLGMPIGGPQPVATVTAIDPESRSVPDAPTMAALFGMTPAECRFAGLLSGGLTIQEAADHLFISPHTAKTHLKRILLKTGTRRQSEMVSLLLTIGSSAP